MKCQACKKDSETTKYRQSYGYMGADGIFYYLCDDCATRKVMWYHILPKQNVDNIILWHVEQPST